MKLVSLHSIKRGFLASACAAAVSLGATSAQATETGSLVDSNLNFYVSMFGGVGFAETYNPIFVTGGGLLKFATKFKTGFIVGGAIGVENFLIENLRTELEVSYFRFKPKSSVSVPAGFAVVNPTGRLSSVNILANVWYDIDLDMAVSPYLGGGAGIGFVNNKIGGIYTGKDVGFAFQLGTGFKYDVSQSIGLDIGYRFRGVLGTRPNNRFFVGVLSMKRKPILVHTVQAGISFKLPAL